MPMDAVAAAAEAPGTDAVRNGKAYILKAIPSIPLHLAVRGQYGKGEAPLSLFQGTDVTQMTPNWLVLRIQPDEGIALQFQVKRPGQTVTLAPISTSFVYQDWFPPLPNVGYETLIYDCMIGDASLFQRADMVDKGWRIVEPVLDAWATEQPSDFPNYRAGSIGPDAADKLLADDGGRAWRAIGHHV